MQITKYLNEQKQGLYGRVAQEVRDHKEMTYGEIAEVWGLSGWMVAIIAKRAGLRRKPGRKPKGAAGNADQR